ncbi:FecCD family ABC transporter permease [Lapidilactobacillus bayanensis]|uniref:FecCD family ABC transporter permease n=1 Tax=Lapidilactobacillus bayanensis TaxID=2485998 RepID=UPI000F7A9AF8|nr:iron ABC transporter permease [Lapidilactobacillus bayanensis]
MKIARLARLNLLLVILLIVVFILNLAGGVHWYAPSLLWQSQHTLAQQIMWSIRLPRALAAALVGALLALSGQLMQTLSKNPIADPSILGVNAGAMLALMLGSVAGITLSVINTIWLSIVGATLAFVVVLMLAMTRQGLDPLRFILGGTVFSGFVSCLAYAVSLLTNTTMQFRNLLVGGFSDTTFKQVIFLVVGLFVVTLMITFNRKSLTLMVFDDATARSLGARPGLTRAIGALVIVISAGCSVAVAGNIGFVGLGIPAIIHYLHPDSLERNILPNLLLGAVFMLLIDFVAKTLVAPTELPLAALSAICGGAFLLIVIAREGQVLTDE